MTFPPRPCAEFPNDNPELHDGAVWVCHWSRARPRAVIAAPGMARMLSSAPEPTVEPVIAVEPAIVEISVEPEAPLGAETPAEPEASMEATHSEAAPPALLTPEPLQPEALQPEPLQEDLEEDLEPVWQAFALELQAFEQEFHAHAADGGAAPTGRDAEPVSADVAQPTAALQLELQFTAAATTPKCDAETVLDEQEPAAFALALLTLDDVFDAQDLSPTPAPVLATPSPGASGQFRVPRPDTLLNQITALERVFDEPLDLEQTPMPPGSAGWEKLVGFLAEFLLAQGATRAAALLPALLEGRRVDLGRLPEAVKQSLCAADVAEQSSDGYCPTREFRHEATAFHLDFTAGRGSSQVFLDWIVNVVRALLASAAAQTAVRVYLEQAGIDRYLRQAA